MAITKHVQHVKSNQTVTTKVDNVDVISPKLPSYNDLKDGEIAVNYHKDYETLSIRNDNNGIVTFPNSNAVATMIEDAMSGVQDALTFDSTPTANSDNPVTSQGIKTYVDNGDKIQAITTYQTSTPVAVNDTHDQAISKLIKIIADNEATTAASLTNLDTTKADIASLSSYATSANYDSNAKKIYLKHDNTVLSEIDATAFIKDGMVDTVTISNGNLVISFNTDAGKEDIGIPISQIFNANNYYTKTEIDNKGYLTSDTQVSQTALNTTQQSTSLPLLLANGATPSTGGALYSNSLTYGNNKLKIVDTSSRDYIELDNNQIFFGNDSTQTGYANITASKVREWNNKQNALTFDNTPTANSNNPVKSGGIKTYVDNGDKVQSITTYQTSTPVAVNDTHDQAISKLIKIIEDNEYTTAAALEDLENDKANTEDLADVAFSGSYNDLENTPTIPTVPTAGTGLTEDTNHALNHTNSVTANTNNVFKTFTYDAQGHVTAGTDASEIDFTVLMGTTLSSSFLNRCATNYTTGAQIADSGIDYGHTSSSVPYTTLPYRTVTPQENITPRT